MPTPANILKIARAGQQDPYPVVDLPGFDPSHLEREIGDSINVPPVDRLHRGFMVKEWAFNVWDGGDPHAQFEDAADWARTQLRRFRFPQLVVPPNFVILQGSPDLRSLTAYQYVQRLRGEELEPANPEHTPFMELLGSAALRYLNNTGVGEPFDHELLLPYQYKVGQAYFDGRRSIAPKLYITDFEVAPKAIQNRRERPGRKSLNPDTLSYGAARERVVSYIEEIPDTRVRDRLLERATQTKSEQAI